MASAAADRSSVPSREHALIVALLECFRDMARQWQRAVAMAEIAEASQQQGVVDKNKVGVDQMHGFVD